MQFHINPLRKDITHALPDAEVFYHDKIEKPEFGYQFGDIAETGWYWWPCLPGCPPDSVAIGPFTSEAKAIANARAE